MSDLRREMPVGAHVDKVLAEIDRRLDWLHAISPLDHEAMWESFERSGRQRVPPFRYPPVSLDLGAAETRLHALPFDRIESPRWASLLAAKRDELALLLELVRRAAEGRSLAASIELFGRADEGLVALADDLLASVPLHDGLPKDAGLEEVVEAAEAEIAHYRDLAPDFDVAIRSTPDLGSKLMVSGGVLVVSEDIRIPSSRVLPLLHHEIGTHLLTWYNGRRQPVRQLAVGLAHYDTLQEGLATLAEYAAGFLSARRLRILAARVIASHRMEREASVADIFHELVDACQLADHEAFDVAVRAHRGGGLTKDVVYLRGLRDLLRHLSEGGDFAILFLGKFALGDLPTLQALLEKREIEPPRLLPRYLDDLDSLERLRQAASTSLVHLYQERPQ